MKHLFILLLFIIPQTIFAQVQFGYLSYQQVIKQMPEYTKVQEEMENLRNKYEEEALRGEEDFQKKFVEFLRGQKDFPQTILLKRQAELQQLMDNGVTFRRQVEELLKQAEKDLLAEVEKQLDHVILEVGIERGYGCVLNTDGHTCPFINPTVGVDITPFVLQKLGLSSTQPTNVVPLTPIIPNK